MSKLRKNYSLLYAFVLKHSEVRALDFVNKYCISKASFAPAEGIHPFEGADYGLEIER